MEGFAKVLPVLAALFLVAAITLVFAPTFENSAVTASITVNTYVDTSIVNASLTFGSVDPGRTQAPAAENPSAITNTANSNTAVDIYLNNTNLTSGANTIPRQNMSVWVSNTNTSAIFFNASQWLNGTSANQGFIENLAISSVGNIYFWQGVPAGQVAGAYSGNVTIHSVADGNAP